MIFGHDSRLAVLESWKTNHDNDCERRYVRIDSKLDGLDKQLDAQTADFRMAIKEYALEQAAARRGIYGLLWSAVGGIMLLLITGMSILLYNLLPTLHAVH